MKPNTQTQEQQSLDIEDPFECFQVRSVEGWPHFCASLESGAVLSFAWPRH